MEFKRKHLVRAGVGAAAGLGAVALVWGGIAANAVESPEGDFEAQVVGGGPAAEGQYPWLVSIGDELPGEPAAEHFCGGSVIAPNVVLTAAHCVEEKNAVDITVLAGSVDLESPGLNEADVAEIHLAHDWNDPVEFANDWALLLLEEELDVEPIDLAADPEVYDVLETAGWGNLGDDTYPTAAQWVEVPFVTDADCQAAYPGEVDAQTMLCAGDLEHGGVDSCDGDSGGPLMADRDGELVLAGIVSWGYECAVAGQPGVYAEVADFNGAIDDVLEDWGVQ
ncbi:serine protease [Glycomyces artemisiae]|uniref:Trypsin n=1 Tax=Glycomyces artemisiae TaxID=1076443 RepID=A0A2T0UP64_9ACTN|nr:serine protease [Glycomyces artemisiae]PRY59711.1 trypsin [Glycomyces artemisiae]